MTTTSRRAWMLALSLAIPTAFLGCESGGGNPNPPVQGAAEIPVKTAPNGPGASAPSSGGMMGGPPGGGMMGGPPGGMGGPATGIKAVMRKLAGPNPLPKRLGNEVKAEKPDWEAIQTQTKDFAALAKELGTYSPPKGSKESWESLTSAFAEAATDLDKAAQAKDAVAANTACDTLANSCAACHKEHQNKRGGGMGGPGFGPPGGGGRPGGPGGPGGGPPPGGEPPK